jgi:hypothetical protein
MVSVMVQLQSPLQTHSSFVVPICLAYDVEVVQDWDDRGQRTPKRQRTRLAIRVSWSVGQLLAAEA